MSVYDYDMATRQRTLLKQTGSSRLTIRTVRHRAAVGRAARRRQGSAVDRLSQGRQAQTAGAPLFLYGYGSYGAGMPAALTAIA